MTEPEPIIVTITADTSRFQKAMKRRRRNRLAQEFEDAMENVNAVLNTTPEQVEEYARKIRDLGR